MRKRFIAFLYWLEMRVAELKDRYDRCFLCGEAAELWCVGCDERICWEHESSYYSDENLCTACRVTITPEEEAADLAEASSLEGDAI